MRTTRQMNQLLKQRIITDDILGACAYSCSKRAKNYRDELREYPRFSRYRKNCHEKIDLYYRMKDELLSIVKPVAVHWQNQLDYDESLITKYFFYYSVGSYSFHKPIEAKDVDPSLLKYKLENFYTTGEDYRNLVSVQFCEKVLELICSKDYTYLSTTATIEGGKDLNE